MNPFVVSLMNPFVVFFILIAIYTIHDRSRENFVSFCDSWGARFDPHGQTTDPSNPTTILYQSCAKNPTHHLCATVPQPGEDRYVGQGVFLYTSCGLFPQFDDIPFIGSTRATKPVDVAVRELQNACYIFYEKHAQGHSPSCEFVGIYNTPKGGDIEVPLPPVRNTLPPEVSSPHVRNTLPPEVSSPPVRNTLPPLARATPDN